MIDPKKRAALGGKARAAAMAPEDRKRQAALAAAERWSKKKGLPKETHSGAIQIGGISIPCAVLEGEGGRVVRVIHRAGLRSAFDVKSRSRSSGSGDDSNIPAFLAGSTIYPHVSAELRGMFSGSIAYRPKLASSAVIAYAYPAEILALMCEAVLDAQAAGKLQPSQNKMAEAAKILHRALARVAITALVDEATGYQYERDRDALSKLLQAYVVPEMQPWIDKFPHEFFKQVHRLWGWPYKDGQTQGPRYVGKIINDVIYKRMPPGVHAELVRLNPAIDGRRKTKHYKFLTGDTGIPHLDKQIASVTTLMAVSDDRPMFEALLVKRFPKSGDQMSMLLSRPDGGDDEQ